MRILYRILKICLVLFILLIIVCGMLIKTFNFDENNLNFILKMSGTVLETFEKWVFKDEYKDNILHRVEKYKNEFDNFIKKRVTEFEKLKSDNKFLESIFIYIVSKNPEKLNDYFSGLSQFKDIIIIDKNNNPVYKESDVSYQISWIDLKNNVEIKDINNEVVLLQNYSDRSFDIDFQIAAILDSDEIISFLKTSTFPVSYVIGNKILHNEKFHERWLKGLNLTNSQKIYKGIYNISVFPIFENSIYIGSFVILYPVRDIGNILILTMKILLLIIFVLSIYELDKFIEGKLNSINVAKKQRLQMRKIKSNRIDENELDNEYEKSLDWVSKYIEKTESGKK